MIKQPFDVVIVSDFSGPASRRFEIMTLFFLASWLEFGGDSRDLPLHIACIGDPPESVRTLGERCSARFSTHTPLLFGGFANKLRGFEIQRETDHILLLDSDMLILSDISGLSTAVGSDCIAAATANGLGLNSTARWRDIHESLGLAYPDGHTIPLSLQLDTYECANYRDCKLNELAPYYNGGIIYAPWESSLGDVWRDHLIRISEIDPKRSSNQPSLATAIHELQLKGIKFRLLPDEYHVRWQHISTGAVRSRDIKLLHTIGFGGRESSGDTAKQDIKKYRLHTLKQTFKLRSHRSLRERLAHYLGMHIEVREWFCIYDTLQLLYTSYVRELE
ncbi:MAG: hypothetical protein HRT89_00090 [Lentisphaeria bacterium]|nr:hypothetical protein [Lentisphaeria bacterium]NQZ66442.1 hypothetical protein [Lentisphaeria bacterium]